jgi:hypothetical protein
MKVPIDETAGFGRWSRTWRPVLLLVVTLAAVAGCGPSTTPSEAVPAANEWREFAGTWTATGKRQTIPLGGDRHASIASFNGALLLAGAERPAVGFGAEVIVLNDTATGMVGRSVWTDDRGDQIYSELRGQGTATGNHVTGTFVGGTGRYAGALGTYSFSWQFVLQAEDGTVQGQSLGLKGRVRVGPAQATPGAGGPAR